MELQTKKSEEWTKCFETSINLPESPFLGFSAMTGDVADNHEYALIAVNYILVVNSTPLIEGHDIVGKR